jgi:hypothetical protein
MVRFNASLQYSGHIFPHFFPLEQLLINIVFRTTVKVHSIGLVAPDDGTIEISAFLTIIYLE